MKKITNFMMALMMGFTFTACGDDDDNKSNNNDNSGSTIVNDAKYKDRS